ncbi:uncharacterized protein FTJAE_6937 [Fusarium tjaetaba]|uniref:NACHT domain-containing protein n=1 Tax=Fusarium tjaetaba TaxID=1567544 RepID=A0A8H5RKU7_9HYPO|nr:uncharacterized protein FTJAE_6937 [Fusarium tjaetaba]KAF5633786.1 hypothetical protein FTJAE_6937 [Fusarium tjaetaba]
MATGLEALGAASAIIQLISFAGSLVSLSFRIYDGKLTSEHELEEYSIKMMEAARRVQSRGTQMFQGNQVGDKLSKVSQDCIDAATDLRKEAQKLTKRYQKGKVFKSFYSAFGAQRHRSKLNQLNEYFKKCKELMETELLLKICDQDTAIARKQSQGFQSLEIDVQNLILKIAEGFTRVEQLVSIEAQTTRDAINTHVTSEFKSLGTKNISDSQRQRLLKSLKSEEIRERYNNVLPSSDACFERVFASYERVCRRDPKYKSWDEYEQKYDDGSDAELEKARFEEEVDEIDHIWEHFSAWLQSGDKLFWIRGKPGSGKSTLVKFVIDNDNTKRLLGSWKPNTRLLSHFFWKIGSEPQNSIRGLLCSLLYNLLSEDADAVDEVLERFKFSQEKDFYKEWSPKEAQKVLLYLLDAGAQSTCIFIDGLDEISNNDGYRALLSVIQRLALFKGLESIGAQNLRLEDLTKPEMVVYLRKQFETLPKEKSAGLPLEVFTDTLLDKAQGVFLWLALAIKSVTDGILKDDDQALIFERLSELPDELESLYQTMWERLNGNDRVYRETAARYFRFVIADGWVTSLEAQDGNFCYMKEPNLVQLSLAIKVEDRFIFPPNSNEKTLPELSTLCKATECDIRTRCAGMLQVGRQCGFADNGEGLPEVIRSLTRPVQFIHRTAHDFLIDTEAGQTILTYKSKETTLVDTELKLLQCRLNLANTYYRELGVVSNGNEDFVSCNKLNDKGANKDIMLEILGTMRGLYETGALDIDLWFEEPLRSWPCVAAYGLTAFDDFVTSSFLQTPSPDLATNSIYELALASLPPSRPELAVRIIQRMIELGGEAHVAKKLDTSFQWLGHGISISKHTTAFESLLYGALSQFLPTENPCGRTRSFLDVIEVLVQTCPDLHRRVILFLAGDGRWLFYRASEVEVWVTLEVDLQFLIDRLLTVAALRNISTEFSRIRELAASFTKPHAHVRHIARRRGEPPRVLCHRILDQEPFRDLIDSFGLGVPRDRALRSFLDSTDYPTLTDYNFPQSSVEEVSIEEEIDMLVQEGVGLYKEEDAIIS